jgi:hypothetical protein
MKHADIDLRLTWLRLGVPLQIPPTSLRYCETTLSVLTRASGDGFERRDAWRAFEAGHGYATGEDTADRSLAEVRDDLARWRDDEVVPHLPPPRGEALGAHLAALARGDITLDGWYEPAGPVWRTRALGGDGLVLLVTACTTAVTPHFRVGDISRVTRLSESDLLALASLPLPADIVRESTADDRALRTRALGAARG